jgi:hypothetical protein
MSTPGESFPPAPAPRAPEVRRPAESDPVAQAARYVREKWVQQVVAIRTCCYRCGVNSDIVHVPIGTMAFGDATLIRRMTSRNERDITANTVLAFGAIGWKFQLRKSYCPACKGLGSA